MTKKKVETEWDRYCMKKKEYEVVCAAGQRIAQELVVLDEQYGDISDVVLGAMENWRAIRYEWPAFYALELIFRVTNSELACKILIPDYVEMCGMIRCVEAKNKLMIREKMTSIAENTAQGFGGRAEVEFIQGFPSVNNDARLTVNVIDAAEKSLESKDDIIMIERPHLGSEDFAYFQEEIPGVIFMLGCKHDDIETGSLHSAILNIDEDSLQYGVRIFGNIALDICGK